MLSRCTDTIVRSHCSLSSYFLPILALAKIFIADDGSIRHDVLTDNCISVIVSLNVMPSPFLVRNFLGLHDLASMCAQELPVLPDYRARQKRSLIPRHSENDSCVSLCVCEHELLLIIHSSLFVLMHRSLCESTLH